MDAHDWIAKCEALPFLHFVPVDNAMAIRSVRLPLPFHKDPADRLIVATAIIKGAPLVTSDSRILSYPHVRTIWN
jgi:PIN domain nuclease of toxin-antitoxin system